MKPHSGDSPFFGPINSAMKHHFADFLARDQGYWTIVPNRERYAHRISSVSAGSPDVTITTFGKDDEHWSKVFTFPNLEELTLHEPTAEQLLAIGSLRCLKRLRITHARPKDIEFVRGISELEELMLEYVSGFSDLTPLSDLKHLRALHVENLRRVSDFSGLAGAVGLQYLAVCGTCDWQQPIADFEFLHGVPNLEVLALWQVKCRQPYPALLPAVRLRHLKELRIHGSYLPTEEYALLEEGLGWVKGADWGSCRTVAQSQMELAEDDPRNTLSPEVLGSQHPEVVLCNDGRRLIDDPSSLWFEFTGRGAGRVKCSSAMAEAKCRAQSERYVMLRKQARALIGD